MARSTFEWDEAKDLDNQEKHGVAFEEAQYAFRDENRIIAKDLDHSQDEPRYYCFGLNREGTGILTVRFTVRGRRIRIYGAGYWRKGRRIYEQSD
ncbi:MAG: BrnT family toxin [Pseudohongiellaceae bacterium]